MNELYDQIALALHRQLVAAGPPEDAECDAVADGVHSCIGGLRDLFCARDALRIALGGETEFNVDRFVELARLGKIAL